MVSGLGNEHRDSLKGTNVDDVFSGSFPSLLRTSKSWEVSLVSPQDDETLHSVDDTPCASDWSSSRALNL